MYTQENTRTVLLNPADDNWAESVETLYAQLGYPHNATLFPLHFTRIVVPKLGGHIALLSQGGQLLAAGFLFPRNATEDKVSYTLRFHALHEEPSETSGVLLETLPKLLQRDQRTVELVHYDPLGPHRYNESHHQLGALDIGRPSQAETLTARQHHQSIWGSPPEMVYPADVYSQDFRLGTALVSRVEGEPKREVVGFLFGCYKLGGSTLPADWHERFRGDWRIESQAMGVLPEHRGKHMAYLLKWQQAADARSEGIGVINWTVDPLQYPNAVLNFGLLRGVAFDHYPDLYPFRNELNQVPASRFGITWLVETERVRSLSPHHASATRLDLSEHPDITVITQGTDVISDVTGDRIAIEIPSNWTAIQRDDPELAARWRAVTDALFQEHVGIMPGKYVITGVGGKEERRYLIGEGSGERLWERIGS